MRQIINVRICGLVVASLLFTGLSQTPVSAAIDQQIANGWFFTQTGEGSGRGYSVTDSGGIPYWTVFQDAGGVQALGYPISQRWTAGPFTYQAFQKAVLQWNGTAMFYANTYDQLTVHGKDPWLDAFRLTSPPRVFPAEAGQPFEVVQQSRLRLLDENPEIRAAWHANANWLNAYGLPVAYEDRGDVRVLRAQRAVFQQWMVATTWAAPGQVVVSNGGDVFKEAGLLPETAGTPMILIPINSAEWHEEIIKNYESLPEASWADGVLTISAPAPTFDQYPAKAWWSKSATKIMAGHAYTMEVDLRVSGGLQGNVLVGLNARHNEGHPNWFQHWHANANSGYDDNHYGDWTEQACVSDVPVDGAWHSVRIDWDGADSVHYWIDGSHICSQVRKHQPKLGPTDQQTFRIYVERFPDPEGPIYTIQIRNFQVR